MTAAAPLTGAYNAYNDNDRWGSHVLELVTAGGWLMILILLSSIVAVAICIERLYTLNPKKIAPPHLLATVWKQLKTGRKVFKNLRMAVLMLSLQITACPVSMAKAC